MVDLVAWVLPTAFVTSAPFGGRPGAATSAVRVGGAGSEVAWGAPRCLGESGGLVLRTCDSQSFWHIKDSHMFVLHLVCLIPFGYGFREWARK